jgi:hypothetical protein
MKQSSTRDLFAYWTKQRGSRPAPARGDIDPSAIRHALGDIFLLAADFAEEQRFRLAGTRVCALFDRELKGEAFAPLWAEASRPDFKAMLTEVISEQTGFVAGVTGRNAGGETIELELLLLPLARQSLGRVRAIGAMTALERPFWLGAKPLAALTLGTVRHLNAETGQPEVRKLAPPPAKFSMRRGFMVYQGGRADRPKAG